MFRMWKSPQIAALLLHDSSALRASLMHDSYFRLDYIFYSNMWIKFSFRSKETNKKLININFSSSVIDWILRQDFPTCHELHQYIHKRLLTPPASPRMMNYFLISRGARRSMRFGAYHRAVTQSVVIRHNLLCVMFLLWFDWLTK